MLDIDGEVGHCTYKSNPLATWSSAHSVLLEDKDDSWGCTISKVLELLRDACMHEIMVSDKPIFLDKETMVWSAEDHLLERERFHEYEMT